MRKIMTGFALAALFLATVNSVRSVNTESQFLSEPPKPATLESAGTSFELKNSQGTTIKVDSSNFIKLYMESVPGIIVMRIEPDSGAAFTDITLSGFSPLVTYHKYEDNFHNHVAFTADLLGKYTYKQDLSGIHMIFIQNVPSTKFIKDDATGGDCATIGTWDIAAKTCTMTTDVMGTIQIDSDGVTLDGNGHIIDGNKIQYSSGVVFSTRIGATLKNLTVKNFYYGIGVHVYSKNNKIFGNNITGNVYGIFYSDSFYNDFTDNIISNNGDGIFIWQTKLSNFIGNKILDNSSGINFRSGGLNHTFYNNYFKNGVNIYPISDAPTLSNFWNTAKTPGENIVGGPTIGGNYWANNTGRGFSETCNDSDLDGICDFGYSISMGNTDEYPLAKPDRIAPETNAAPSGVSGANSWYVSDVSITLSAGDNPNGSGVNKTEYGFDNISWEDYILPFTITGEGKTTVYYRSIDKAGNIELAKNIVLNIDKSNPVITGDATTEPNQNGWYNNSVVIRFNCEDGVSGPITGIYDLSIDTEGAGQSVKGECADKAGNVSSLNVEGINIDKTLPTVSVSRNPEPNVNGWNSSTVNVTFNASDSISGIDGLPVEIVTIDTEGANQAVTRVFKDKAGNIANAPAVSVNIDLTSPEITGAATTTPNSYGWYNSNVTVHFLGSDSLSGVAKVTPDAVLSNEGSGLETAGSVEDLAGNHSVFTVSGINIDKTPPVITGAATSAPNGKNWYNSEVLIKFAATDNLSGVEFVTPDSLMSQEGASQSVTGVSSDKAGNSVSLEISGINIDKTRPVINGAASESPNSNGWYSKDVLIRYSATDTLSGIDTISPDETIAAEGQDQSATGETIDNAGNIASIIVSGINIDKTPPNITGQRSPLPDVYGWNNSNVEVSFICNDVLSGMDKCSDKVLIADEGAGQSVAGTAIDKAGNSKTITVDDINIDKSIPETVITLSGTKGLNSWYVSDVLVTLTVSNNGVAGIDKTEYGFDGTNWNLYANPFTINTEGINSLYYRSTDKAGNVENVKNQIISIDKTAPIIAGAPAVSPNANNWFNGDVLIHFTAVDSVSGILSVTPDTIIAAAGPSQSLTGTAFDNAGNSISTTVKDINIDKSAPVTESVITGNSSDGCYSDNVNISLNASDDLSGVAGTFYNIDNAPWASYEGALNFSVAGLHTLNYQSMDNADNKEIEKSALFTIGKASSEAMVRFDPATKDIKVYGEGDAEASYSVLRGKKEMEKEGDEEDKDTGWELRQYTIKGCGDNLLTLVMKYKKEGKEIKARIISVKYKNGTLVKMPDNKIEAEYSLEKKDSIKNLEQKITVKKKFEIDANYSSRKGKTEIDVKPEGQKKRKETKDGMVLLKLFTENGVLKYEF